MPRQTHRERAFAQLQLTARDRQLAPQLVNGHLQFRRLRSLECQQRRRAFSDKGYATRSTPRCGVSGNTKGRAFSSSSCRRSRASRVVRCAAACSTVVHICAWIVIGSSLDRKPKPYDDQQRAATDLRLARLGRGRWWDCRLSLEVRQTLKVLPPLALKGSDLAAVVKQEVPKGGFTREGRKARRLLARLRDSIGWHHW
jgi:hypothetical protein